MRRCTGILAAVVALTAVGRVPAQVVIYDNTTTDSGFYFPNGGASGGNTSLIADDIVPAAGFVGRSVSQFSFSVVAINPTALSVVPTVGFWDSNGANAGPGTLLASF